MFGLEAIWRNGEVVGHIRRADFGFAIDKTIAYGYIRDPAGGPVSTDPREWLCPHAHGGGLLGEIVALFWFSSHVHKPIANLLLPGEHDGAAPGTCCSWWRDWCHRQSLCRAPVMLSSPSAALDVNCNRVIAAVN